MPTLSTGNTDTVLIIAAWCSKNYLSYLLWTEFRNPDLQMCFYMGRCSRYCSVNNLNFHKERPSLPGAGSSQSPSLLFCAGFTQDHLHHNFSCGEREILQQLEANLKIKICAQINRKTNTMTNKDPLMYLYKFNIKFCFKMSISLHLLSWIPPRQMW